MAECKAAKWLIRWITDSGLPVTDEDVRRVCGERGLKTIGRQIAFLRKGGYLQTTAKS